MTIQRLSPREAFELVRDQGYVLVDVRTVPEFDAGHPEGAFNVPIANASASGMVPNDRFVDVMARRFAKDAGIVLSCKSGARSLRAANALVAAGFTRVVDQRAGWGGAADPFGKGLEPGWAAAGLPVSTTPGEGRSYAELSKDE